MPPKRTRINKWIRVPEVLLIDEQDQKIGTVPTDEALKRAEDAGLDLVEVAPNLKPPVCKILDFGKYQYNLNKSQVEQRKKNKTKDTKEIRLGLKISDHDLDIKNKRADKFLSKGHKVKITIKFKGREIVHPELGRELLNKFLTTLETAHIIEKAPAKQGKQLITFITPKEQ